MEAPSPCRREGLNLLPVEAIPHLLYGKDQVGLGVPFVPFIPLTKGMLERLGDRVETSNPITLQYGVAAIVRRRYR
jgi:hypothetical protein